MSADDNAGLRETERFHHFIESRIRSYLISRLRPRLQHATPATRATASKRPTTCRTRFTDSTSTRWMAGLAASLRIRPSSTPALYAPPRGHAAVFPSRSQRTSPSPAKPSQTADAATIATKRMSHALANSSAGAFESPAERSAESSAATTNRAIRDAPAKDHLATSHPYIRLNGIIPVIP